MPKLALFDMDGTLFDHDSALRRDLLAISSPSEQKLHNLLHCDLRSLESIPHMQRRIDLIRVQPGWWRELARFSHGWDIL